MVNRSPARLAFLVGLAASLVCRGSADTAPAAVPAGTASAPITLDKVVVSSSTTDASTAIADKQASDAVQDVVSGSALKQANVRDAADALKGVSGVAVTKAADGSNSVSIRGLAPQFNRVSVDGQRQSNTSRFSSGTSLDSLPPEILQSIEVSKSLTPDMDADAIGGVINLSTANPSDLKHPFTEGRAETVIDSQAVRVGTRSSVGVGKPFRLFSGKIQAGLLATFSFEKSYRQHESVESFDDWPSLLSPGPAPYAGTLVPAFTRVNLEQTLDRRERTSALLNADLRLGPTVFVFKSNASVDSRKRNRTQMDFDTASGTPVALTPDAGTFSGVSLQPHGVLQNASRTLTTVAVATKTDSGRVHVGTNIGLTSTVDSEPGTLDTQFSSASGTTVSYDTRPNRMLPVLVLAGGQTPQGYDFGQLVVTHSRGDDEAVASQVDVKIDLDDNSQPSFVKVGGKLQEFSRSVAQNRTIFVQNPSAPTVTMTGVVGTPVVTLRNGGYTYGPMPEPQTVANEVAADPGLFEIDSVDTAIDSTTASSGAHEAVWAGYAMGKERWGSWSLVEGVRVEGTSYDATANQPVFSPGGTLSGFSPASDGRSYVDVMPGLHLRYEPSPGTIVRASVYHSLIRPAYGDLAPYLDLNFEEFRAREGNPALKPYEATNYDLSADRYTDAAGLFSASVFFKSIRNFQSDSERVATIGDLGQFLVYQKINGDTATVAGLETSWKSSPWTLPDGVSQVTVALTDTITESASHLSARPGETLPLPQQSKNQFSATLHAERGRYSADANATYRTSFLVEVVSYDRDRYQKGIWSLDLSAACKLDKRTRLVVGAANVGTPPWVAYSGQPTRLKEMELTSYQVSLRLDWKL